MHRAVDLKLPESGAGFSVDWPNPRLTSAGIEITDATARGRYEANYKVLVGALRTTLAGFCDVYTHNPWGEYGHAEHIQVHRAVAALQDELGYTIWYSNYIGPVIWPLARLVSRQPCWTHRREVRPDVATARKLMRIYRRYGAWTWTPYHRWPAHETVYAQPPAGDPEARQPLAGEWMLDHTRLRWWPLAWRSAARRLE